MGMVSKKDPQSMLVKVPDGGSRSEETGTTGLNGKVKRRR